MARRPPPPPANESPDEVEARFYEALQRADLERLMSVWADDDEIVCVHPGGLRVVGAAAIRASFEALLARGGLAIVPDQVRRLAWSGGALHHLVERLAVPAEGGGLREAWVIVSNVYVRTPLGWRLAAHHATPGSPQEPPGALDAPSTLH
ncbi:MAG: nuclear transport factor 2 family protein [Burkholderiales bacterium]|nr:nuclear transport factor 2 family protein [Burkholderiales bacterium]